MSARPAPVPAASGFLAGRQALAAIVLWHSGHFDTEEIAQLIGAREDAVCRTLHLARDGARADGSRRP